MFFALVSIHILPRNDTEHHAPIVYVEVYKTFVGLKQLVCTVEGREFLLRRYRLTSFRVDSLIPTIFSCQHHDIASMPPCRVADTSAFTADDSFQDVR